MNIEWAKARVLEAFKDIYDNKEHADIDSYYAIDQVITEWGELMERADKYRWHDLRKDPDDLPDFYHDGIGVDGRKETSDRVCVAFDDGFQMMGYFMNACWPEHNYWDFGEHYRNNPSEWVCGIGDRAEHIIAWKEVELFGDDLK